MNRDLMRVIEQILQDGHLSTETLAHLRAEYEAVAPDALGNAMKKKPEALRIADALDNGTFLLSRDRDATAQELRRLHYVRELLNADVDKLRKSAGNALEVLEALQAGCTDSDDGTIEAITVYCPEVIAALRDALEGKE